MSRILSLAAELEIIRKKSKRNTHKRHARASSYTSSRTFNAPGQYNFNDAYNALQEEDNRLVQQRSLAQSWVRSFEGELVFQEAIPNNTDAFVARVREISTQLRINPNWLMGVMRFESRLNPAAVNPHSNATGLIQFMPSTARGLGTTTEALAQMTNLQQLDYVLRYYMPHSGRMRSYLDCYLVTFYPAAMGRPDTFVLGSQQSAERAATIARSNPGMDTNRDGQISVAEVRQRIYAGLSTEQTNLLNQPYSGNASPGPLPPVPTAPASSGGSTSSGGTGSNLGSIAGGVIGGVAAGPIGAIVGSEIGQRVGNWISGSQSYGLAQGYYARAYDTPSQVVAQEILREAQAAGARVFFLHSDRDRNTLEQFASTGAFSYQPHTGRTFDLTILQSLKAIQTASLHSNLHPENPQHSLSIMSLFRPDGHSPHFRGVALDLHRIAGIPIDIFNQNLTLQAVLFAIDNLAPGRYRLGLPRPPKDDGSDANNPATFESVRNRVRTELFNGSTPTPAFHALLAANNFLGARWNEHPRPTATALQDIREPARAQLQAAITRAAARGAIITQLMADGLDHLHIDIAG